MLSSPSLRTRGRGAPTPPLRRGLRRQPYDLVEKAHVHSYETARSTVAATTYFFLAAPFSGFTSTVVAVMRYSMVTLEPTLRSPFTLVDASRAISQRSFPFCTAIISSLTSSTGPVT